jgi:flagellar biosynthesis/type III secretory pathway M-ring protein FliF/YscJ
MGIVTSVLVGTAAFTALAAIVRKIFKRKQKRADGNNEEKQEKSTRPAMNEQRNELKRQESGHERAMAMMGV